MAYGLIQRDLAHLAGNPAYVLSGFSATVPAELIADGSHRIGFKVVTADGRAYEVPDLVVTVPAT